MSGDVKPTTPLPISLPVRYEVVTYDIPFSDGETTDHAEIHDADDEIVANVDFISEGKAAEIIRRVNAGPAADALADYILGDDRPRGLAYYASVRRLARAYRKASEEPR